MNIPPKAKRYKVGSYHWPSTHSMDAVLFLFSKPSFTWREIDEHVQAKLVPKGIGRSTAEQASMLGLFIVEDKGETK